ncbi:MAG: hypothetical protein RIS45_370 [Planctomycetota bacterium]|jgi:hypothetical protein
MAARKRSNRNRAAWEPAGGYAHRGEPDPRAKDPKVEGRLREALARAKDAYMSGGDDYAREALYRAMDGGRYALDFGDVWSQQNAIQRIEGTLARNGAGGRRRNRAGMPKRSARTGRFLKAR